MQPHVMSAGKRKEVVCAVLQYESLQNLHTAEESAHDFRNRM